MPSLLSLTRGAGLAASAYASARRPCERTAPQRAALCHARRAPCAPPCAPSWGVPPRAVRVTAPRPVLRRVGDDGPNMAAVNNESSEAPGGVADGAFGPEAILLINFQESEVGRVRGMMNAMGADFIQVLPCTKAMLGVTLAEALMEEEDELSWEEVPESTKRVMILSGMSSAEVVQVLDAYEEEQFFPCVFAAAVPNNMDSNVNDLAEEVHEDHVYVQQQMLEQQKVEGEVIFEADKE